MKENNTVSISKENGTLNKEKLAELFHKAIENENYVRVYVSHPNYPVPELVVIPRENLQFKLEYYNKILDDNLRFNADKEVFIYGRSTDYLMLESIVYERIFLY